MCVCVQREGREEHTVGIWHAQKLTGVCGPLRHCQAHVTTVSSSSPLAAAPAPASCVETTRLAPSAAKLQVWNFVVAVAELLPPSFSLSLLALLTKPGTTRLVAHSRRWSRYLSRTTREPRPTATKALLGEMARHVGCSSTPSTDEDDEEEMAWTVE